MNDALHYVIGKLDKEADRLDHFLDEVLDTGETWMKSYAPPNIPIKTEKRKNTGRIIADSPEAVWYEFGTGVKYNGGKKGVYPHPKAQELGLSAIGEYGKGLGANPNGWYYNGKRTFGIDARMFVYRTARTLEDLYKNE